MFKVQIDKIFTLKATYVLTDMFTAKFRFWKQNYIKTNLILNFCLFYDIVIVFHAVD